MVRGRVAVAGEDGEEEMPRRRSVGTVSLSSLGWLTRRLRSGIGRD